MIKRYLLLPIVPFLLGGWTEIGIDFRDSAGYVTDPANHTYCLGDADTYPVSRGGASFGWVSGDGDSGRDRDTSIPRLAGSNSSSNDGSPGVFKLDLTTSGTKIVCVALGDMTVDVRCYQYAEILDDTTSKFTIDSNGDCSSTPTAAGHFIDTTATDFAAASFFAGQTCQTVTFATTTLVLKLGTPGVDSGNSTIAHMSVTDVASGNHLFLNANGDN